jgi:cytochrome c553
MKPFAAHSTDEDIKNFADYFGNLTRQPDQNSSVDASLVQLGADIAEPARNSRPLPACETCHAKKNPKLFGSIPDLAGQPADYLSAQLQLFRSGVRSGTENARIMGRMAQALSDRDIRAVSAYFSRETSQPSHE